MAPLSEVIREAENVAGDLLQSLPDIGAIVKKIDPHATAVDRIVELAPRLEAVVQRLEQIAGIALPEPPAPEPSGAPATSEPPAEPVSQTSNDPQEQVTIKVTPEEAVALGKTPIQVTAPEQK